MTVFLASGYFRTGLYDKALARTQSILEDSAWHLKAVLLTGCLAEQDDFAIKALEALKRLSLTKRVLNADLKEIHYNLAQLYLRLGNEKASQQFKRIVAQGAGYRNVTEKLECLGPAPGCAGEQDLARA